MTIKLEITNTDKRKAIVVLPITENKPAGMSTVILPGVTQEVWVWPSIELRVMELE